MNKLFNVGDKVYGFCNGYFGSSDYDTKICVMVNTRYAVFQYLDGEFEGNAIVLNNPDGLRANVEEWKKSEEQC